MARGEAHKTLVEELTSASALLADHKESGHDPAEVLDRLHATCMHPCEFVAANHPLRTVRDKATMEDAIASGPWTAEQESELRYAIAGKAPVEQPRRKNQYAPHIEFLLSESVWAAIRAPNASMPARCHALARHLSLLGFINPGQQLLHRLVVILSFSAGEFDMSQADVFKWMDKMQEFIKSYTHAADVEYITHYPNFAAELPDRIRRAAFPDDVMPVMFDVPELDTILSGTRMRGRDQEWLNKVPAAYRNQLIESNPDIVGRGRRRTSKSAAPPPVPVKPEPPASVKLEPRVPVSVKLGPLVPVTHVKAEPASSTITPAMLTTRRLPALPASSSSHEQCHACGRVMPMVPTQTQPMEPAPVRAQPVVDAVASTPEDLVRAQPVVDAVASAEDPKPMSALLVMETAMSDGAAVRKRPAADRPETVHAPIAKRPAGASGADGWPCMNDVFETLESEFDDVSRNTFTCRAYDTAARRAKAAGFSTEKVKEFRTLMYNRAKALHSRLSGE